MSPLRRYLNLHLHPPNPPLEIVIYPEAHRPAPEGVPIIAQRFSDGLRRKKIQSRRDGKKL